MAAMEVPDPGIYMVEVNSLNAADLLEFLVIDNKSQYKRI